MKTIPSRNNRQANRQELDTICDNFRRLIDDPKTDENNVQTFMENHSELIPTPFLLNHNLHFESVITKLRLNTELTTDFVYYTKSSSTWWCCLIELESPHKRIFTNDRARVTFTAEFTRALGQVESWRSFVTDHADELNGRLAVLRNVMPKNRVKFKYVLVYGRGDEMKDNQERINRWDQQGRDDLTLLTYDSLFSHLQHNQGQRKNILSEQQKGFAIKLLNQPDTMLFARFLPHEIFVSKKMEAFLESRGYKMKSWRKNYLLTLDGKYSKIDGKLVKEALLKLGTGNQKELKIKSR